jgi:hypothetical protein
MSFRENLQAKIQLDRLVRELYATLKEGPGQWHVDKELIRTLLSKSDFTQRRARDLELYVRPLQGEMMEVLVFDNELPSTIPLWTMWLSGRAPNGRRWSASGTFGGFLTIRMWS